MHTAKRHFIPAAGISAALPLYEPLLKLIGANAVQTRFVHSVGLQAEQRVLEIGCGPGNVTLLIKQACPSAHVVGLDPDAKALARARDKAARAGLDLHFQEGFADALPFADGAFDKVLSSFMWHHLSSDTQHKTLRELMRVLAPGGQFHLIDFAPDQLVESLTAAGFQAIEQAAQPRVLFQRVFRYRSVRPAAAARA
jgi:ubiquinone/menaquinone biosynthesis C-methylase UbiE